MKIAQVKPSITSQKYSNELNFSADFGEQRRGDDQHQHAEDAADHREHEPGAERDFRLALLASAA